MQKRAKDPEPINKEHISPDLITGKSPSNLDYETKTAYPKLQRVIKTRMVALLTFVTSNTAGAFSGYKPRRDFSRGHRGMHITTICVF